MSTNMWPADVAGFGIFSNRYELFDTFGFAGVE